MTNWNYKNLLPSETYLDLRSSGFPGWVQPLLIVMLDRISGTDVSSIDLAKRIDVRSSGKFCYRDVTSDAMPFIDVGEHYQTVFHFQNFEDYKTFIMMVWQGNESTFYDVRPDVDAGLKHSCYQCAYVRHGIIKPIWSADAIRAYSKWADGTAALKRLDMKYGDGTFLRGVRLVKHWSGCKLAWMVDVTRLLVYKWLEDHPEDVAGYFNRELGQHYYELLSKAECLYLDLC